GLPHVAGGEGRPPLPPPEPPGGGPPPPHRHGRPGQRRRSPPVPRRPADASAQFRCLPSPHLLQLSRQAPDPPPGAARVGGGRRRLSPPGPLSTGYPNGAGRLRAHRRRSPALPADPPGQCPLQSPHGAAHWL